ncbi:MAG: hypothetical protein R2769_09835 [Saprospiraceae bacterium]
MIKFSADAVEERGVKISYNASVTDVRMEGTTILQLPCSIWMQVQKK